MYPVIGLGGRPGSGKDTIGAFFQGVYGYDRLAFADVLKDEVADVYGIDRAVLDDRHEKEYYRVLLQEFAQEKRDAEPDYWIEQSGLPLLLGSVVVTDCRYQNELDCIRQMGGRTVFVQDSDADQSTQRHCSEHLTVCDFDYSLSNCKRRPELTIARILHLCDRLGLPTAYQSRVEAWRRSLSEKADTKKKPGG